MTQQSFEIWMQQEWDEVREEGGQRDLMERYREIRGIYKDKGYNIKPVRQYEKKHPIKYV